MNLEMLPNDLAYTGGPRVSFSGNLSPVDRFGDREDCHREDSSLLEVPSSTDFRFCTPEQKYSSSADQLFCNGQILPIPPVRSPPRRLAAANSSSQCLREMFDRDDNPASQLTSSKSLRGFERSNSLGCGCITKCGFLSTLNGLGRSRSAGRVLKDAALPPTLRPQQVAKPANPSKKPSPKKKEYTDGRKISPVRNVPSPYISTGKGSLFSFGYFNRKKEKSRKLF